MKILTFVGAAIAIVGIAFVAQRLVEHADELASIQLNWVDIIVLAAAALLSALLCLFLGLSWQRIVQYYGGRIRLPEALRIYGISNVGKYIPGNVFQYAGRQALAQQAGINAAAALKTSVFELGLFAAVSIVFALLVAPAILDWPQWTGPLLFLSAAGVAGLWLHAALGKGILIAAAYQAAYLLGVAIVFIMALEALTPVAPGAALAIVGAYVVSWLVGLVTPGAPAGIGVRELALFTLLMGMIDQATIAPAVVLGRVVNVVGDLLFFAAVLRIRPQ